MNISSMPMLMWSRKMDTCRNHESEGYFMYCEDMDWCKRAHLAEYDVMCYPNAVVEYKDTRAARKSWEYAKIHLQSLFTYWRKFGIRG